MGRKWWQRKTASYSIPVTLVLLGIVAFIVTDRRVAGMYFVALILLLVADWRYRRYARTSAEARRAQTEIERP